MRAFRQAARSGSTLLRAQPADTHPGRSKRISYSAVDGVGRHPPVRRPTALDWRVSVVLPCWHPDARQRGGHLDADRLEKPTAVRLVPFPKRAPCGHTFDFKVLADEIAEALGRQYGRWPRP